jgi:hypothetical protein
VVVSRQPAGARGVAHGLVAVRAPSAGAGVAAGRLRAPPAGALRLRDGRRSVRDSRSVGGCAAIPPADDPGKPSRPPPGAPAAARLSRPV